LLFGVAAVGWSPEIRSLRAGSSLEQPAALRYVRAVAGIGSILALGVYGLLLGLEKFQGVSAVHMVQQLLVALVIGLSMGVMGMWLMRLIGRGRAEFILVLVALVSLIVGAAMSLGSSPLFVALLSGAVVVNLPHPALDKFKRVILEAEQPVAMALMLMAGLMVDPRIGFDGLMIVGALVFMRAAVKLGVIRRSARQSVGLDPKQPILVGFMRQSPLAMALAVAYAVTVADLPEAIGRSTQSVAPPLSGGKVLAIMVLIGLISEAWPFVQRYGQTARAQAKDVEA
ncbi:MAG: hypothetical protein R3236_03205, partial [Phycisphaeraceae bacterium]|nr:hypothetical protein [Phycisphaeraceae bacterium]